jgi:hypothetical protein
MSIIIGKTALFDPQLLEEAARSVHSWNLIIQFSLLWISQTIIFLKNMVISLAFNPQIGGPVMPPSDRVTELYP